MKTEKLIQLLDEIEKDAKYFFKQHKGKQSATLLSNASYAKQLLQEVPITGIQQAVLSAMDILKRDTKVLKHEHLITADAHQISCWMEEYKTQFDASQFHPTVQTKEVISRSDLMDKMQEIMDGNYNKFKGTNEAELFSREEIADLFEKYSITPLNTKDDVAVREVIMIPRCNCVNSQVSLINGHYHCSTCNKQLI